MAVIFMNDKLPAVLVFRKRILPYSETFIADQGQFLKSFNPVFTGFQHSASGEYLLQNSTKLILEDYTASLALAKIKHRLGFSASKTWLKALEDQQPELIHAHFANDAIDGMYLSQQLQIPFVATIHGHDITKSDESYWFRKNRNKLFGKASKMIAVSNYIGDVLIAKGCPEQNILQHYIGIDVNKFAGLKIESEQPNLLFVGRLVEKKGCSYLLDALAKLKPVYPELLLNIVGSGPLESKLRQQVIDLGLNVNFLGHKTPEQIRELMLKAWLFTAPSITADNGDAEGLGMVFLEAQALRTPVISFTSGGVVEAVEHGVTGLLSPEKDVDSLAENISYMIENSDQRVKFGDNGRKRIEQKFDIIKQCQKLEDIYQSVI